MASFLTLSWQYYLHVYAMLLYVLLVLVGSPLLQTEAMNQWSFQGVLRVSDDSTNYGKSPSYIAGRGFVTMITGYDSGLTQGQPSGGGSAPGIYVHNTDDGYIDRAANHMIWSQQAKLVPRDANAQDNFGKWMVFNNQTILVSAPFSTVGGKNQVGSVYVFNGTMRQWSQVQKLTIADATGSDLFGEYMSLYNDRVVVTASGQANKRGAAYIFERNTLLKGGKDVLWSRQGKLVPLDSKLPQYPEDLPLFRNMPAKFAKNVALYDDIAILTANHDPFLYSDNPPKPNARGGSAYIFQAFAGKWSQQQQLVGDDLYFHQRDRMEDPVTIKRVENEFFFGTSISVIKQPGMDLIKPIEGDTSAKINFQLAVGVLRMKDMIGPAGYKEPLHNYDTVYMFNGYTTNRWSLQQRLFTRDDSQSNQLAYYSKVTLDNGNNLIATVMGFNTSYSYLFKSFGNGWSQQQRLISPYIDETNFTRKMFANPVNDYDPYRFDIDHKLGGNWSTPSLWGGSLTFQGPGEVFLYSRYHNKSCIWLWLSDHFLDGWDKAVFTVRAPNTWNDTFHPHCDQINPFYVRYCPYQPEDEGVYILKVFAPTRSKFYWEIGWKVYIESTGQWIRGDYSTKVKLNFNATTMDFSYVSSENVVNDKMYDDSDETCYRCMTVSTQSWAELQQTGGNSFWPLVVQGAPYYISDYNAVNLFVRGKVCHDVQKYECYMTLNEGIYILRVGGGYFGYEKGFPRLGARWEGCGESGTDRDQLIFRIKDSKCFAIQKYTYTSRCDEKNRPPLPLIDVENRERNKALGIVTYFNEVPNPAYFERDVDPSANTHDSNSKLGGSSPTKPKIKFNPNPNPVKTKQDLEDDILGAAVDNDIDNFVGDGGVVRTFLNGLPSKKDGRLDQEMIRSLLVDRHGGGGDNDQSSSTDPSFTKMDIDDLFLP